MNDKHNYNLNTYHPILQQIISKKYLFIIICFGITFIIMWEQCSTRTHFISNFKGLGISSLANGNEEKKVDRQHRELKYMLLWTSQDYHPFYYFNGGQKVFTENKCSSVNCFVTDNRNLFGGDLTKFDAIAFNGRNLYNDDTYDIPKSRSPRQKYVFFNLESAENYPMCSSRFNNFFNWTATYRLDSDIPFPYIQIKNQRDKVVGPKQNMEWRDDVNTDEEFDYRQSKTKAVAWFVSNCNSRSGRELYANSLQEELKKYGLTVDIYGVCGPFACPRFDKEFECNNILKRDYFFYLSFENSFAEDYVTEKLLTALQHNVVPIVLGGADYNRFLPPGSYLDALALTPHDLAATINEVMLSPSLYNRFFKWKSSYKYRDPSTDNVCAVCAALNNDTLFSTSSSYEDFRHWWYPIYDDRCSFLYFSSHAN